MVDSIVSSTRARDALAVLVDSGGNASRQSVWADVVSRNPLTEADRVQVASGGDRGEVDFNWRTAEFVKAGWLYKGGSEGWAITDAGRQALEEWPDPVDLVKESRTQYAEWSKSQTRDKKAALESRVVPIDASQERVISAARVFVERSLVAGESLFSPGRELWTPEILAELEACFIGVASVPGKSFLEQLAAQLAGASDDAKLLMAELVWLQVLPTSTDAIGARKKAERVEAVLGMMTHPVQIPADLSAVLSSGAFHPGQRMVSALGAAMAILVNFASAWTKTGGADREVLLDDPWAFRAFVLAVPGESFPSQRWSLMFLVHPEAFVSIVSEAHKRRIRGSPSVRLAEEVAHTRLRTQYRSNDPAPQSQRERKCVTSCGGRRDLERSNHGTHHPSGSRHLAARCRARRGDGLP